MGLFSQWTNKEDSTSYLASVSDLMAGLLFIFILIIVFSAHSLSVQEKEMNAQNEEIKQIKNRLAGNDIALRDLLLRLQDSLKNQGVPVVIDESNGILRIPEQSLTFPTGKADLSDESRLVLRKLRTVLEDELVCYSKDQERSECKDRNPYKHTLDAVFIEGHTDNQPYGGDLTGKKNRNLSTARANTVYESLLFKEGELRRFRNPHGETLFSLSGYGSERPVPGHNHLTPTNDSLNRRIELRFLMTAPKLKD